MTLLLEVELMPKYALKKSLTKMRKMIIKFHNFST